MLLPRSTELLTQINLLKRSWHGVSTAPVHRCYQGQTMLDFVKEVAAGHPASCGPASSPTMGGSLRTFRE